ncbi:MAG: aminotransferase class V-fold PLP-dependent enzyme [Candidatus Cloacimonetes bacterium]|nr:aminotransferase class V-fold PLP-dependent enzyme [Candidatus Cloacimonadota bacterium]
MLISLNSGENMDAEIFIQKLDWLRKNIIGRNKIFKTSFGEKPLVYADYTASGRNVFFIENYMLHLMELYANTHTEDDYTGKSMSCLLHEAEKEVKRLVNAGPSGKIIFTGTGATGGITKLQQILGVYWTPATKSRIQKFIGGCKQRSLKYNCHQDLYTYIDENEPVVFVGPYEHHSNEIMWRQTLCEVVEIPLNSEGKLDLIALEKTVSDKKYYTRQKIGSFSAASNVSGIKTPVYEVAAILHKYGAIACFDFAACAPYVDINMNYSPESYFDAIFFSPHKFLGGPGSSGVLIINEKIYQKQLPPSVAAGGTVSFVTEEDESYVDDIEEREKPGTPGILQAIKVALAFKLKEKIGINVIDEIENYYLTMFYKAFAGEDRIVFYGTSNPSEKINIVPFNIKHRDRVYHPKFITKLMNDLFGIQTRAGCSCAGPYGHRLLSIDKSLSERYRNLVTENGLGALKPGWVRLNMHYSLSHAEFNYLLDAIKFIINNAEKFLPLYHLNFTNGEWCHINEDQETPVRFDLKNIMKLGNYQLTNCGNCAEIYSRCLKEANEIASKLSTTKEYLRLSPEIEKLSFFYVVNSNYNDLNNCFCNCCIPNSPDSSQS